MLVWLLICGWRASASAGVASTLKPFVSSRISYDKTYIFELFYPGLKKQAVFTVPTRALANYTDKLEQKHLWHICV